MFSPFNSLRNCQKRSLFAAFQCLQDWSTHGIHMSTHFLKRKTAMDHYKESLMATQVQIFSFLVRILNVLSDRITPGIGLTHIKSRQTWLRNSIELTLDASLLLIYRDASLRVETEVCRAWKHALRRVQVHGCSANPQKARRRCAKNQLMVKVIWLKSICYMRNLSNTHK